MSLVNFSLELLAIDESIPNKLCQKNVIVLPDPLVNAGAVIADSIEKFAPKLWVSAEPNQIYDFVHTEVCKTCTIFFNIRNKGFSISDSLKHIKNLNKTGIIGNRFIEYINL